MPDGFRKTAGARAFVADAAIGKNLLVAPGAAQDSVKVCTAVLMPIGVTLEAATVAGQTITVATDGVAAVVAAGAVNARTAGIPTTVYAAAGGKVDATGTITVGRLDTASADAGADGDIVTLKLELTQHEAVTLEALGGVATDDARLSDARDPKPHAATHATGAADEITPASIGATPSG